MSACNQSSQIHLLHVYFGFPFDSQLAYGGEMTCWEWVDLSFAITHISLFEDFCVPWAFYRFVFMVEFECCSVKWEVICPMFGQLLYDIICPFFLPHIVFNFSRLLAYAAAVILSFLFFVSFLIRYGLSWIAKS